jgi:hypothetical protein
MDFVHETGGEREAAPAPRRLAELAVNLARTTQALGRDGTNLAIPMTVADAHVHGAHYIRMRMIVNCEGPRCV